MKAWRMVLLASVAITWMSCGQSPEPQADFYYWRSELKLDPAQGRILRECRSERLYVHLFDVAAEGGEARPTYRLQGEDSLPEGLEWVPVVYIQQQVFSQLHSEARPLADRMLRLVDRMGEGLGWPEYPELQLDCDWTPQSRGGFFELCGHLADSLHAKGKTLSATIRLHQAKRPQQTGVPPVDRGLLMFYNMGLGDSSAASNILDLAIGERYLKGMEDYPLPLDLALPIYSWGVVHRRGRPVFSLPGIRPADLQGEQIVLAEGEFQVRETHYRAGRLLYAGDAIQVDTVAPADLLQAAELLARHLPEAPERVIFYQLDSMTVHHFPPEILLDVVERLR